MFLLVYYINRFYYDHFDMLVLFWQLLHHQLMTAPYLYLYYPQKEINNSSGGDRYCISSHTKLTDKSIKYLFTKTTAVVLFNSSSLQSHTAKYCACTHTLAQLHIPWQVQGFCRAHAVLS